MKINTRRLFCSKFETLLIVFGIYNNTTVCFSRGIKQDDAACKATSKNACVVVCRHWDLGLQNGVERLIEILRAEGKKFSTCALIFEGCTHDNDTINPWGGINDDFKIDDLKIFHSSIDINKLNLKIFKNLRQLSMKNTTTAILRSKIFGEFQNLRSLRLKNNKLLKRVENGFLRNLTLYHVEIQELDLNRTETVQFFKNLTGEREIPTVRELDWSHNNFGNFPKSLLTPFPNLKVLILTNSSIFGFEDGIFDDRNFTRVYFNKNKIERLPEKIFRPLIQTGSFVSLEGNRLICDCEMEWVQSLMKRKQESITIDCAIPEGEFFEMEMCPEKNSENPSAAHCSREENSKIANDYKLKKSSMFNETSHRFTITNEEPEHLEITISETIDLQRAFLWYGNYKNATSPQFNCLKILQQKFTIFVEPDVNYLICLATVFEYFQIDLSDCLPLKTKPLYEDQPWLTKKSITLSIISIFVVFLFALATGALILYLSVRKNPSLIRGSKRVIEVKRHDKAQILIMPRGYENLSQTEAPSLALARPHLPLEPSRSCDTISTVSYVSANQPTQLEILTYRFNRLRELFQRNNNLPSPVPPLSMQMMTPINQRLPPNVDLLFEYEWYTITTTTTTTEEDD